MKAVPFGREMLFGLKAFTGAMLALYIALWADLPRPSWAMLTAVIVAQPLAGMVASRAVYRVVGTLVGTAFAVAVIPSLVDAPVLLTLVLALWIGLSVYLSLLDGTPRSYAFALVGYTAALVGFPSVDTPGAIFDTGIARAEEITLGILSVFLVSELIFPARVGPLLQTRLDAWLTDAARWADTVLAERHLDGRVKADQRRLAVEATALDALRIHAAYDTPEARAAGPAIVALQREMQMLLSMLFAIEDRLGALRPRRPALAAELLRLLAEIRGWVRGVAPDPVGRDRVLAMIARAEPADFELRRSWEAMLRASLLARLADFVRHWSACRELRAQIRAGTPASSVPPIPRHRDRLMAALSSVAVMAAVLLLSAFWIATGWPDGGTAVMFAAVVCSLFAANDDPAPLILNFLKMAVIGTAVAAVYLFAILPQITGFPSLVLVMAPFFVPVFAVAAIPAWYPLAFPLALVTAISMGLQTTLSTDFAGFLNAALALITGVAVAAVVVRLIRSVGAVWSVRRMSRATQRDLAAMASDDGGLDRDGFEGRMIDRISAMVPRLATVQDAERERWLQVALADLRVGLNLTLLQQLEEDLPPAAVRALRLVRGEFRRFFRGRDALTTPPTPQLLRRLDRALRAVARAPISAATDRLLLALIGTRRALCPKALALDPRNEARHPSEHASQAAGIAG